MTFATLRCRTCNKVRAWLRIDGICGFCYLERTSPAKPPRRARVKV